MAEIRPRLRLGQVGPKKESETLPGLGCFSVEEEVGNQRCGSPGLERGQGGSLMAKVELVEELDAESR
jgi:hypothetical protein